MTFIRLSDVERDQQVLVNVDHIVQVSSEQGPRGLEERATKLVVLLSNGSRIRCFPVDAHGGFDSSTDDESAVVHNFQLAVQHLRSHPAVEQGRPS